MASATKMAFCLLALTLAGTFLGLAVAQFSQDPPASHLDVLHSERSIMEFLGSKSPFESHSDTYSLVDVPEQCRLVSVFGRGVCLSRTEPLIQVCGDRRCI